MWYTREAVHLIARAVCLAGLCLLRTSAVAQDPTESGHSTSKQDARTTGKPSVNDKNKPEKQASPGSQSAVARAWEILDHGVAEKDISKRTEAVAALGIIGSQPRANDLLEKALK